MKEGKSIIGYLLTKRFMAAAFISLCLILVFVISRNNGGLSANGIGQVTAKQPPLTKFKVAYISSDLNQDTKTEAFIVDTLWTTESHLYIRNKTKTLIYDLDKICLNCDLVDLQGRLMIEVVEKRFWMGTDAYGRDVFSRFLQGVSTSFIIAFISVLLSVSFGVLVGILAGYFGGVLDKLVMWMINLFWSIPSVLVVISVSLALGSGVLGLSLGIATVLWIETANVTRFAISNVRSKDYVLASQLLGLSHLQIITKHVLPNSTAPIAVIITASFADAITLEAGLSFLGIGLSTGQVSLGTLVNDTYGYMLSGSDVYLALIPILAVVMVVLLFAFMANTLRSSAELSPYKRSRGMT